MKRFLILLCLNALASSARAERSFEEKKLLLQATTSVSSLIYSGRVIAEATLANDTNCQKEQKSADNQENPAQIETLIEVNGKGCSIAFREHKIYSTKSGSGKADIELTTGLNVRPNSPTTIAAIGGFKLLNPDRVLFKGKGSFKINDKFAEVIDTESEIVLFKDSKKARELKYISQVKIGIETVEVRLSSQVTTESKVETKASIDNELVTQEDLEIMFPNIYKSKFN